MAGFMRRMRDWEGVAGDRRDAPAGALPGVLLMTRQAGFIPARLRTRRVPVALTIASLALALALAPATAAINGSALLTFTLPGSAANVGTSVAVAGDVNGDGYSDLIVGAAKYSNGQSQEGELLLF